jgi:hypothetical protein
MNLPDWMKIGDKGPIETLLIWGLPVLFVLGLAFAIWGSIAGNPSSQNPSEFDFDFGF